MFPGFFLEFYNFPGFLRFWCERAVFFFFFSFAVVSVIFLMISARSSIIRPILIGELFFPDFLKFGSNWRYVSIYGGVLSLYVEIFSSNKNKFVKFHVFGKKKTGRSGRLKNCAKKIWKLWGKSSPIIRTLICWYLVFFYVSMQGSTSKRENVTTLLEGPNKKRPVAGEFLYDFEK